MVAAGVSAKNANLAQPTSPVVPTRGPGRAQWSVSGPAPHAAQSPTTQSQPTHPQAPPQTPATQTRATQTRATQQIQIDPAILRRFTVPTPPPKQPDIRLFQAFFLTPRVRWPGSVVTETKPHVFVGAVLGADQKAQLMQILDDVRLDLSNKVSFGKFTSVKIKVTTRNNLKKEISGYEVWFSPKVLFDENHQDAHFDRPSSPTDYALPPGNYVIWTRRGSAQGPIKQCKDVGRDGLSERLVDPLFVP
jgi:hypothetical protein